MYNPSPEFTEFKAMVDRLFRERELVDMNRGLVSVVRYLMNDYRVRSYEVTDSAHKNMLEYVGYHYASHPKMAKVNWGHVNDIIVQSLLHEDRHAEAKLMWMVNTLSGNFKDYDINATREKGISILMSTSFNGKTDAGHLRFLVEKGANVHAASVENGGPMHFLEFIRDDIAVCKFKYLVGAGADPLDPRPFERYDSRGRFRNEKFTNFAEYMNDVKAKNSDGMSFGKLQHIEAITNIIDRMQLEKSMEPTPALHQRKRRL